MATHDLTTGGTAQPFNMHCPVAMVKGTYDAAVDGGVSGDWYKLVALPQNAVVLCAVAIQVGGADNGDTVDLSTAASGTTIQSNLSLSTNGGTSLCSGTNLLVPASGGIWMKPDATLTAATIEVRALVAYTNLDPTP